MNPEFDEVLLTAYLDNEVTDSERMKVEEQLRVSESSRILLEELRSVRTLVAQLHLSQPSRDFQVGPWNETNPTNEASPVVLNDPGSSWKVSYQRLASIAALIAIAVCTTVFLVGPNRISITQHGAATIAKRDEKSIDLSFIESVRTDQERVGLAIQPGVESPSRTLSSPAGNAGLPSLEKDTPDVALSMSRSAAGSSLGRAQAGRSVEDAPIGVGGGFGGGMSSAPLSNQKSAISENRNIVPAPVPMTPAAAPITVDPSNFALGISKPEEQVKQSEPSVAKLFDSFFDLQSTNRSEWEAVDSKRSRDTFFFQNGQLADFALRQDSENFPIEESIASYSFRYRSKKEQETVPHEKDELKAVISIDRGVTDGEPADKAKQSEAKEKKSASVPMFLEFQIPSDDWEKGAKRLRELGIDVPIVLPEAGYIDFVAFPTEAAIAVATEAASNSPERRLAVDANDAGSGESHHWRFKRLEQLGREDRTRQPALEATAERKSDTAKNGRDSNEDSSSVRIRVRSIKP